ncbi:ImmA/IrrE family metallo-endopeptidase [Ferruginibacter albus]|uniref:ImmA/IrrE family metallo-endopeptidase n=1 Tax=Ferruginibacter albus TaxID=2875540 RepID=UPI001CC399C2|nr:ImmA/IrrE family metallo-endopeptidase [Ferruginibacter albus]UAY51291.1 ImmA/IrrE family metallo-endopeptidase [Ferruginibacter albus]
MNINSFVYTPSEIAARQVLIDCGIEDPTEIPLKTIILSKKAFYEEVPLDGKEGEIVSANGRSIISINSNIIYEGKKRFTAAHELGHFILHRNLIPVFSDTEEELMNWYQAGPHEQEANQFAAEFLMPSHIFHKECEKRKFGPEVIGYLAQRFVVSKTAAILKFVARGNHPVFIIYCKDGKMKWWKKSTDFYSFCNFKQNAPIPSGSVAAEIFAKKKAYLGDEAKQEIWKSDWFELKENEEDSKFFEYCLYSPTHNYTISVIWQR